MHFDAAQLAIKLDELIKRWEDEVTEFKRASADFDTDTIGRYFSALANEANLRGAESAWLVFGVDNKTRAIVGSDFRYESNDRLQGIKQQIVQGSEPSVTFRGAYAIHYLGQRVVMFEIPAAPRGIPIAWKGHYYARAHESLGPLGLEKQDAIRQQTILQDWSAQVVVSANVSHLSADAVRVAREAFAKKHANRFSSGEVDNWPDETFLERARLTRDGAITRATLLLLGAPESAHLLSPHPATLVWKLVGAQHGYEHFEPPFLLNTSALYRRIRNLQVRVLPQDELIPIEVSQYDQQVVLEALHNCIAHQDYSLGARIILTEHPEKLVLESDGAFFEGSPQDYMSGDKTPSRYRNPFLVKAMTELNMIDTMGYGIFRMLQGQAKRYFPLPDYDLSLPGKVRLTIHGSVVDPAYSRLLISASQLPLADIFALDRVQKRLPIEDDVAKRLRKSALIEGRKPNYYVSATIAGLAGQKTKYIRTRAQDDTFYAQLIVDLIERYGSATRKEINDLLLPKLSEILNEDQKINKINNLLTKMRRSGRVYNAGADSAPRWKIAEKK